MRALATLVVSALLLGTGCATYSDQFGTRIRVEHLDRVVAGETTRDEILALFGPPSAFYNPTFLDIITGDQRDVEVPSPFLNDVFTYRFIANDTRILFIPALFMFVDGGATYETLSIFFDAQGIVEYHAYRVDPARPKEGS